MDITPKRIALFSNVEMMAGRLQLIGVFRYMREHSLRWLIETDCADTPDGCIANDASAMKALRFERENIPIIVLDAPPALFDSRRKKTIFINVDNNGIAQAGVRHLQETGRFRICTFIQDRSSSHWSEARRKAFRRFAKTAGLGFVDSPDNSDGHPESLPEFLGRLPKPAAVMAANDRRAMDVIEACKAAGVSMPDQLKLLGVDNDGFYCDFTEPTLSSVDPDFEEEGYRAAAVLDQMLSGRKTPGSHVITIRPKGVIRRASTTSTTPTATIIQRGIDYIGANFTRNISVNDVAAAIGISRRLADLRFRQILKTSINELIISRRLSKAKELLIGTRLPIASIAVAAGFRSANYAMQLFRRKTGTTMLKWRHKMTNHT